MTQLILASTSASRRAMIERAGVDADAMPPMVDEGSIKESLLSQGLGGRDIADALAEAKAVKLSRKYPKALVIGADQTLQLADGRLLDKPQSPEEAAHQLDQMAGKTHNLFSAAVVAENGEPIWRFVATSKMTMRLLSDRFIADYVGKNWEAIRHCVGCYQVEAAGAHLFSHIQGSHYDIMGLPLLPLMQFLRDRGVLPT